MIFDDLYISKISSAVIGAGTDVNGEFTLMGVRDGDKIIGLFKHFPSMPDFHLVYEGTLTYPKTRQWCSMEPGSSGGAMAPLVKNTTLFNSRREPEKSPQNTRV